MLNLIQKPRKKQKMRSKTVNFDVNKIKCKVIGINQTKCTTLNYSNQ